MSKGRELGVIKNITVMVQLICFRSLNLHPLFGYKNTSEAQIINLRLHLDDRKFIDYKISDNIDL